MAVSCRPGDEIHPWPPNGDLRPQADLRPVCLSDGRDSQSGHCTLVRRLPNVANLDIPTGRAKGTRGTRRRRSDILYAGGTRAEDVGSLTVAHHHEGDTYDLVP
jgi:hypothetical protein